MVSMIRRRDCDEERSTIIDKGDIGFIDLRVAMLDCMHVEDENDLWKIAIYDSKPKESFTLSLERPPLEQKHENELYSEVFSIEDRFLQPGKPLEVWLTCKPKDIGMHTAAVHVQIDVHEIIERVVFVLAEDEISESLNPNSHYDFKLYRDQGIDDETVGKKSSWFNRFETSKTVEIIRHLTEKEVSGKDQIAVGSADQLQSREKQVVVVSIARSTMKYNYFDRSNCPGLLCNRRRFIAAITAARSLLIVIGNPHIVCKDLYWSKLLWYCVDNGAYEAYLENSEEEEAVWLADDANQANMGAVQMGNENEANGMDKMQVQRA
ncbi:hypothetical protein POM88_016878 [Heracleum sosnowskyi]|uniref:DNA2/NAM7 helicase-like C-terminal domain-containing protein n=1 Tax=Heracleum sosnowskyi TaxID=360622 RepID=A0AAD8IN29_9APIA|nr:hypothetical protein POM88_016878 [Heracleum sosnowskyi]